ncbi:MAG TPA: hypothetical protein VIE65_12990 [Methylobacter sp.]|jgi:hypothetical protein
MLQEQRDIVTGEDVVTLARKSWTSYVFPLLFAFGVIPVISAFIIPLAPFTILLPILLFCYSLYRVAVARSVILFYDNAGVWLSSGILPWARGTYGVKWRDIEAATYYQSFSGWLFNSYDVRISNRFNHESEIFVKSLQGGKRAIIEINNAHELRIANHDIA